jgi:hypothetical protein
MLFFVGVFLVVVVIGVLQAPLPASVQRQRRMDW